MSFMFMIDPSTFFASITVAFLAGMAAIPTYNLISKFRSK